MLLLALGACGLWEDDERYHPPGYKAAEEHGLDSNRREQVCVNCHAPDLRGDPAIDAVSCDGCHHNDGEAPEDWRTDCTFCHGGLDDNTGAPPEDIQDNNADASFGTHTAHGSSASISAPLACSECHLTPDDALSVGHLYDETPARAEVDFSAGRSHQSTWDGVSCANNYCHGDGQDHNGTVAADADEMGCDSCHAGQDSDAGAWAQMSGTHGDPHLEGDDGIVATCSDCHSATVTSNDRDILDPALHVDGLPSVRFDTSDSEIDLIFEVETKSCTGTCHGVEHNLLNWYSDGTPHPDDYELAEQHGLDAKLDVLTEEKHCNDCHGMDLRGTPGEGRSCDGCHHEEGEDPEAWRTDCIYCHGGVDNLTGAPPEDIRDTGKDSTFGAHTAHTDRGSIREPLDCVECHVVPADVLSIGHMWDGTAGAAEDDFSGGLSWRTRWDATSRTCSGSYCHGNGQGHNGTIKASKPNVSCSSCHAGQNSSPAVWAQMSGTHGDPHLEGDDGIVATCSDCHSTTVATDDRTIISTTAHINGQFEITFDPNVPQITMTYNATQQTCSGRCHGERHNNEYWFDD